MQNKISEGLGVLFKNDSLFYLGNFEVIKNCLKIFKKRV